MKCRSAFVCTSALVALWAGAASAVPIANGNFDGGLDQATCTDALTSWAATPGIAGDFVFPNSAPCDAAFTSIDSSDTLSQSTTTTVGQDYVLSFQLSYEDFGASGALLSTFTVTFGGFTSPILGGFDVGPVYTTESFNIPGINIGSSSTTLTFEGFNATDPISLLSGVWHLDDVVITAAGPANVPEPPAILLLGAGLIGLLGAARLSKRIQFSSAL